MTRLYKIAFMGFIAIRRIYCILAFLGIVAVAMAPAIDYRPSEVHVMVLFSIMWVIVPMIVLKVSVDIFNQIYPGAILECQYDRVKKNGYVIFWTICLCASGFIAEFISDAIKRSLSQ